MIIIISNLFFEYRKMSTKKTQALIWMLLGVCFIYFPAFASYEQTFIPRRGYNGMYDLSQNFENIIQAPPQEFIDLQFYNDLPFEASGTYQLIPYYQKVSYPG